MPVVFASVSCTLQPSRTRPFFGLFLRSPYSSLTIKQWKKEQASHCCTADVCLRQSVNQLYNDKKMAKLVPFSTACVTIYETVSFNFRFWCFVQLFRVRGRLRDILGGGKKGANFILRTYLAEHISTDSCSNKRIVRFLRICLTSRLFATGNLGTLQDRGKCTVVSWRGQRQWLSRRCRTIESKGHGSPYLEEFISLLMSLLSQESAIRGQKVHQWRLPFPL